MKQRSKKCVYKGMDFDSLVERDYYKILEELQSKGEISDLRIQEKFILQEGFILDNGTAIKPITYSCDQYYTDKEENVHIVDCKGSEFTIEETFKLKFKMLKNLHRDYIYHIVIRYDGKWFDLENKEDKKVYKLLKAEKKLEREKKRLAKTNKKTKSKK